MASGEERGEEDSGVVRGRGDDGLWLFVACVTTYVFVIRGLMFNQRRNHGMMADLLHAANSPSCSI